VNDDADRPHTNCSFSVQMHRKLAAELVERMVRLEAEIARSKQLIKASRKTVDEASQLIQQVQDAEELQRFWRTPTERTDLRS
jgi:hypothetical protein